MKHQGGFTLIEVVISLAISLLLFGAVAFSGLQMVNNSQFTDTLNNIVSFLQNQYEESRDGVSPKGFNAAENKNHLLRGKLIWFNDNKITSYFVISSGNTVSFNTNPNLTQVKEGRIYLVAEGEKSKDIDYNAQYIPAIYEENNPLNAILILRSADSALVEYYSLSLSKENIDNLQKTSGANLPDLATMSKSQKKAAYLIKSTTGGYQHLGAICLNAGGTNGGAIHSIQGLDNLLNLIKNNEIPSNNRGTVQGKVEERCAI